MESEKRVTYLNVKALESGTDRIVEGWASTPREDRAGDVVVPEGASYELPLPLLFAHKHDEPIGSVISASVTKAGIRIRAKLTAGVARAEEVWNLIKDGALTAVSIGFLPIKSTPLANGGMRFDSWSWYELSVVSVPCNPDAKIAIGKGIAYADKHAPDRKESALPRLSRTQSYGQGLSPEMFGQTVGFCIAEALKPIKARLDAAEKGGGAMRWKGFWESGDELTAGSVVVHDGNLWIANNDTAAEPAKHSASWTLLARK